MSREICIIFELFSDAPYELDVSDCKRLSVIVLPGRKVLVYLLPVTLSILWTRASRFGSACLYTSPHRTDCRILLRGPLTQSLLLPSFRLLAVCCLLAERFSLIREGLDNAVRKQRCS